MISSSEAERKIINYRELLFDHFCEYYFKGDLDHAAIIAIWRDAGSNLPKDTLTRLKKLVYQDIGKLISE